MVENPYTPRLISVAGGAAEQGKSTLTGLLAGAMAAEAKKVLVIELTQEGRLSRLRHKEMVSGQFRNQRIPYEIVQVDPALFHEFIPSYAPGFDLIFIEIPFLKPFSLFADVLLLSHLVICPIYALAANAEANSAFFRMLASVRTLKESKKLSLGVLGLFNKFRPGQPVEVYLELARVYNFSFFSAYLKYGLSYQDELSTYLPPVPTALQGDITELGSELLEHVKARDPAH